MEEGRGRHIVVVEPQQGYSPSSPPYNPLPLEEGDNRGEEEVVVVEDLEEDDDSSEVEPIPARCLCPLLLFNNYFFSFWVCGLW